MQGWLARDEKSKLARFSGKDASSFNWKRYYFQQIGNSLAYYKTEAAPKQSGTFPIDDITEIQPVPESADSHFAFKMISRSSRDPIVLQADSAESLKYWISGILNLNPSIDPDQQKAASSDYGGGGGGFESAPGARGRARPVSMFGHGTPLPLDLQAALATRGRGAPRGAGGPPRGDSGSFSPRGAFAASRPLSQEVFNPVADSDSPPNSPLGIRGGRGARGGRPVSSMNEVREHLGGVSPPPKPMKPSFPDAESVRPAPPPKVVPTSSSMPSLPSKVDPPSLPPKVDPPSLPPKVDSPVLPPKGPSLPPKTAVEPPSLPPKAAVEPPSLPPKAPVEPPSLPPKAAVEPPSLPPKTAVEPPSLPPKAAVEPPFLPPKVGIEPPVLPPKVPLEGPLTPSRSAAELPFLPPKAPFGGPPTLPPKSAPVLEDVSGDLPAGPVMPSRMPSGMTRGIRPALRANSTSPDEQSQSPRSQPFGRGQPPSPAPPLPLKPSIGGPPPLPAKPEEPPIPSPRLPMKLGAYAATGASSSSGPPPLPAKLPFDTEALSIPLRPPGLGFNRPNPYGPSTSSSPRAWGEPAPDEEPEDDKPLTPEQEAALILEKRTKIVNEILSTEETYIKNLQAMITIYKRVFEDWVDQMEGKSTGPAAKVNPRSRPLSTVVSKPAQSKFKREHLKILFSNIQVVVPLNQQLYEELSSRLAAWSETQRIGDIFVKMAPYFKLYNEYSNNYEAALQLFDRMYTKDVPFVKTLELAEAEAEIAGVLRLENLLILPIQRVPRYNLLIADLRRKTDAAHPDFQSLTEAGEMLEKTAQYLESNITQAENNKRLLQLAAKGAKGLLASHRVLIREGTITAELVGKPKKFKLRLTLFNDLLVHLSETKSKKKSNMEQQKHQWPLYLVWLKDLVDAQQEEKFLNPKEKEKFPCAFELIGPMATYIFWFADQREKDSWFTSISKATKEEIGTRKFMQALPTEIGEKVSEQDIQTMTPDRPVRVGIYHMLNGGVYQGWWHYGTMHGLGAFSFFGNIYLGEFQHNVKNGRGELHYSTGETYVGHWQHDLPNSSGVLTLPNGDQYEGSWESGRR
ncbi:MAG: hypothetical protein Q8P67_22645, partial [archaeon]|nr:hypothetical protein [archaeon]